MIICGKILTKTDKNFAANWLIVYGVLLFIKISKKYNMALCPASSAMVIKRKAKMKPENFFDV
jgi:hypothetical protein